MGLPPQSDALLLVAISVISSLWVTVRSLHRFLRKNLESELSTIPRFALGQFTRNFYIFSYLYIYIHIHRHKPCFSVDFLDGTTPTSAWPPDRCSVPCVSTVAVPRPVPRSLPVRRNGETWWFYAWTMNSTINAVCDSDKKIFQSRLLLNVDTQQHELNKL